GAGNALEVDVRVGGAYGPLVCAARDRGRCREQADPPRPATRHRQLRGRRDHPDHIDLVTACADVTLEHVQSSGARGVACDHQQLGPELEQVIGDLDRERLKLLLAAGAVWEARGVAQIYVVL